MKALNETSSVTAGGVVIRWILLGLAGLYKYHKKTNGHVSEVAKLVIICQNTLGKGF